ncbi:hypothetical protein LSH36_202g12057 [Paralvinella palmiformis]|uniref:Guanylate cyclase domain-containing protein n=1 Tax=Paralvinella palmiformis TaxID=53620 RepID=A0AAD9JQW4_9ANNE|nr:hypothetical protein LSH36_202g12057 [Paralvinella palmiformis]
MGNNPVASINIDAGPGAPSNPNPRESEVDQEALDEINNSRSQNLFRKLYTASVRTALGRRIQIGKVIGSSSIPFFLFLIIIATIIGLRMQKKQERAKARETLDFSIDISIVVHALQKERDTSVVYAARDGDIGGTLSQDYAGTDKVINNFSKSRGWKITSSPYTYMRSADALESYVKNHRLRVNKGRTPNGELLFYGEIISNLIDWQTNSLPTASVGTAWKMFVSLNEIAENSFNKKIADDSWAAISVRKMSDQIRLDPTGRLNQLKPSLTKYRWWYDNVTVYIDQLLEVRQKISAAIRMTLDDNETTDTVFLLSVGALFLLMAGMLPIVIIFLYSVTNGIHKYLMLMANRTKVLNREQKNTDNILYSMLPKSVAEKLKEKKNIVAESFSHATLFFSDIVDFTGICSMSTTMQVVYMLDDLYSCFDETIKSHDVYKVTTIGDSYMMVSGVPQRNGRRHAAEICTLALDIMERVSHLVIPHMMDHKLQIRIGIHTGVLYFTLPDIENTDTYWLLGKRNMGIEYLQGDTTEDVDDDDTQL